MKTQSLRSTLILLSGLALSSLTPVSIAQSQDYSRLNLPDGAIARLGKGGVSYSDRGIAFSPDGTKLASASMDGVRLWDVGTGQLLAALTGVADSPGFSVAFSADGTKLASGSWDDTVGLWDVLTRKHIATFRGHTGNVRAVAFSPDGTNLASGSLDGTVLLWRVSELINN